MSAPLPNRVPRPPDELARLERAWALPRGVRLLSSVNNTTIGLFYIATSLLFLVLAGALALLMRAQLAVPGNDLVSPQLYNQLFTMHGTVMMFLFAVPVVEAFAVFLLPNMLGARDLPFPRLSAYAYWAYAIGGLAFFATIFFGVSPDGGWFMYPPLTSKAQSPGLGADFWLLGIGFIEISAIAGAIELIVGILLTRAPGMSLARMPVYAWAMLVVGFMIVFAFPAVIAGTALLELERAFDWPFFDARRGGDPLLWQHLFWFFGHPEVYIIFLPAAGLVSMMLPVLARTPLVGDRAIVFALAATGIVSFALWAHHMFTAGLGVLQAALVSAASLAVAVPASVQVFAWLATIRRGRLVFNPASLWLLGFLVTFALGGLTGVMVAVLPFDALAHDSHFVVAHLHYVLIGGTVFPILAAIHHWTPLVNGHRLSERLGRWSFALIFGGFHVAFFPLHVVGLQGMPRRVQSYADSDGWAAANAVSSAGALLLGVGFALFFFDAIRTWCRRKVEHGDPWRAATLEWLPAEQYGLRSLPQVDAADPLWARPALHDEVPAGAHWLPGTVTGRRETLVTTPRAARLSHLIVLPGDGWAPLVAAIGTAGFFLLLTVHLSVPAWVCAAVGIAAAVHWLWRLDRPPPVPTATVGDGVTVPVRARGRLAHDRWGTAVLVVVDATVWASFAFAHVHVSLRADVCPPPGAALPAAGWWVAGVVSALASAAAMAVAQRVGPSARGGRRAALAAALAVALACGVGAFAASWAGHHAAALRPTADAWSATVAALLAYQGLHAVVLGAMALYLLARIAAGLLRPDARSSFDNVALYWHAAIGQAVASMLLVQLLPGWMR